MQLIGDVLGGDDVRGAIKYKDGPRELPPLASVTRHPADRTAHRDEPRGPGATCPRSPASVLAFAADPSSPYRCTHLLTT
jgi:hypothetical protein